MLTLRTHSHTHTYDHCIVTHDHRSCSLATRNSSDGRRSVVSRASHMNHAAAASEYGHGHAGGMTLVPGPPPPPLPHHMMPGPPPPHLFSHHHHHHHPHFLADPRSAAYGGITMGTLRSTKSVPAIAMMNGGAGGDSCPVHGQELGLRSGPPHHHHAYSVMHGPVYDRRMLANSVVDLRTLVGNGGGPAPPPPPPPPSAIMSYESKKMQTLQLPIPPSMYARHVLLPTNHHHHHQTKTLSPMDLYSNGTLVATAIPQIPDPSCCKGHLIVLWIILAVVTLGVTSGIVLGVTMN